MNFCSKNGSKQSGILFLKVLGQVVGAGGFHQVTHGWVLLHKLGGLGKSFQILLKNCNNQSERPTKQINKKETDSSPEM